MTTRWFVTVALAISLTALGRPVRADELIDNSKALAATAGEVYELLLKRMEQDAGSSAGVEAVYQWSRRWMEAEQDASDKKEDKVAAAQAHLERMRKLESRVQAMHKAGFLLAQDEESTKFYRLQAERLVLLAKGK